MNWLSRLPPHLAGLAPDQAAALQCIVASGRNLDALVGPAGSGKTTALAALTDFWHRHAGPVVGLALSATAALRWRSSIARARPSAPSPVVS